MMIRHRVHLIMTADELRRPVSFRTDVILSERNPDKAYSIAQRTAIGTGDLIGVEILNGSVEMVEL